VFRALVPPEQLRSSTGCKPESCRCGQALQGADPAPLIRQVADLPRIAPLVDGYRLHRRNCPGCGPTTCARLPEVVGETRKRFPRFPDTGSGAAAR
jgi:transposase